MKNKQTLLKGQVVIIRGRETVVTLGSNYPTAGKTIQRRYNNIWEK